MVRGDKRWVFVPYLVAEESVHGDFQRQMRAEQVPLDADGLAGVPGLPFVLGWRAGVRFLVVAEGQWDAVTFAGACGWLEGDSAWPEGACVVGVRGASGVDTLLAYFGSWLERERPAVLVLADNDQAGRKWDTAEPMDATVPGSPLLPTFAEKLLRRPGQLASEPEWVPRARRVEVRRVAKIHGKDFNDYWKARKPSPVAMMKWLREMDYLGADGTFK